MPVTPLAPPLHHAIALPGRRRVTLVSELGRGGTAVVFRGIFESESHVRRPVAVKLFDLSSCDEPDIALLAIGRAAQRAACVTHPNAVQTYELACVDGRQAIVIGELVDGTTLARLLEGHTRAGRRMPLDLALFVTTEIAEALSGARMATTPEGVHAGIAHLDVTLHQVLLSVHGEVKLSDFGLSQVARWGSSVRSVRAVAQRASSMSPEIARGRAGDTRSDVFSLGIALREMIIGPRFASDVSDAQALEHARDGHVPPTFVELQLPKDVREILRKALEADPMRRYAHATAMAYDLRRVALSMGVSDGRMFLRSAIAELAAASAKLASFDHEEKTEELDVADILPPTIPPDRESGLIRKAGHRNNGTDE